MIVWCGSHASVHSHKPAGPSRASESCPTSLRRSLSLLKSARTDLRACPDS